MKKVKDKNMKRITDFFTIGNNIQNSDDINEINSNKKENKANSNENYLSLYEEEDSNSILNNHQKLLNNNNKYKKKKIEDKEEISNNLEVNDKINHILINPNIDINPIKITPSFFINVINNSPIDENRKLILLDLTNNKSLTLQELTIKQNNFRDRKEYNSSFPFQFCQIININNIAYITGGKLNDELSKLNHNNELGEKKCYKIIYHKEKNEIEIDKLPSSIFEHQSHSLLYSKKFNAIFICSGYKQRNCEYFDLNENKWKRLYPLQKPRENALAFLFNEKYIFLIGGKNNEGNINEDYDVIDFEIFLNNKVQNYWKSYSFNNRSILERLGCGIIRQNDNVFILGGYNKKNEFCSWKINFEQDKDDNAAIFIKEKIDKNYKISSIEACDKINNYFKKNKIIVNNLCYCGQQIFLNNNGFLFNISLGGQLTIIPENIL